MAKKSTKELNLQDQLDEMRDIISSLLEDLDSAHTEIRYLDDFTRYKNLEKEYQYFRKNAHEEYKEDLPFPHLTL